MGLAIINSSFISKGSNNGICPAVAGSYSVQVVVCCCDRLLAEFVVVSGGW